MKTADNFFNNVDYVSIIDTVKGIFTSDGSMSVLLDFERVLDEADLYAFKNWELGELVQGPDVKRYSVACIFMFPYNLMPDPRGAKRLASIGSKIKFKKTKIKVPVAVKDYEDYIPGTKYPKTAMREVWLVYIELPKELMDDIKEGSIDLAGQTVDLNELDDAYDNDLDKEDTGEEDDQEQDQLDQTGTADAGLGMAPTLPPM
jgi:hypothetical protein